MKLFPTILLNLFGCFCFGQTFFVDAVWGNDQSAGSMNEPWQTLDSAFQRIDAGDTLFIRSGDYRPEGQLLFQLNGTQVQPILISGYEEEIPIVHGFTIAYSSWLEIGNIEFLGPQQLPPAWQDMPHIMIDEPNVTIDQTWEWSASVPRRLDSVMTKYSSYANFFNYGYSSLQTWENTPSTGINLIGCENMDIRNSLIRRHTYGIRLRGSSKHINIHDNVISHCLDGITGFWNGQPGTYSFGYCSISGNSIRQSFRNGIMLNDGANHNTIAFNDVMFTGQNHISTYNLPLQNDSAGYNVISDNTVAYGGYYAEFMEYPGPSAISLHSSGPGCEVSGNYISHQVSTARYGINLMDGNCMIADFNPHGSVFSNNVCYRPMGNGMSVVHSSNHRVIHNTFIEPGHGDPTSIQNGVAILISTSSDVNNIFSNNIFSFPKRGGIFAKGGNLGTQTYIDHNMYHVEPNVPVAANGVSTTFSSLPYAGRELNGLMTDPLMIDSLGHLAWNSPAIGAGGATYSNSYDIVGTERDILQPTIGAYELAVMTTIKPRAQMPETMVYPNPTDGTLNFQQANVAKASPIQLYDLSGKLLFEKPASTDGYEQIDLIGLVKGVYILRVGSQTFRIQLMN